MSHKSLEFKLANGTTLGIQQRNVVKVWYENGQGYLKTTKGTFKLEGIDFGLQMCGVCGGKFVSLEDGSHICEGE